jgi:hypothetical protein
MPMNQNEIEEEDVAGHSALNRGDDESDSALNSAVNSSTNEPMDDVEGHGAFN